MNLADALRLENSSQLALVGAGGKTSAMFAAAMDLSQRKSTTGPVLLTTTTHLALEQCRRADHHRVVQTSAEVSAFLEHHKSGVTLFTGLEINEGRIAGPRPDTLAAIHDLAEAHRWPLLIEADGSRLRPLKAPAESEPVIPEWVDQVLVCAGLNGLEKPLTVEWVHRPEIYAQLAGLDREAPISPDGILRVLTHPAGGLKAIPTRARRIALLNQADTPEKQAIARRMAGQLLDYYDQVIISSLNPPQGEPAIYANVTATAGIVLAAGAASRFGQVKQLLELQGETFVHRAARIALEAGLKPVSVVTGAHADQISAAVADLHVQCVFNPDWEKGQGNSVAAGIRALSPRIGAAIFLLADQPLVSAQLISSLVETHARDGNPIIGPLFDGQRGNPVLFDRSTFQDLSLLQGDTGGRAIFSRFPVRWIPWHDTAARLDIDTPTDYGSFQD